MEQEAPEQPSPEGAGRTRIRPGCWIAAGVVLLLLLGALAALWLSREAIADDLIADMLEEQGVEASYTVEQIGPHRQVLRDIVVGDPKRPDLTIQRAEVTISPRFGFPEIDSVTLVRPRLFATLIDGKLSLGALDPLVFTGEDGPFEFPDFELAIEDGRALLESEYGPVGAKMAGGGHLRGGFVGELALTAPALSAEGCRLGDATAYGRLTVRGERPGFEGPVRFSTLNCGGAEVADGGIELAITADRDLEGVEGTGEFRLTSFNFHENNGRDIGGDGQFTWRDGGLTARYDLDSRQAVLAGAAMETLRLDGSLRARRNFARVELSGSVDASSLQAGPSADDALAGLAGNLRGTLIAPILERVRAGLARNARENRFTADYTARITGDVASLVVPNARLRGRDGETLLNLTRLQALAPGDAAPRLSGSFATGGADLPHIAGRVEENGGDLALRLSMEPFASGESRLAVPELTVRRRGDGALGFSGRVIASGALPGGRARELALPLSGSWSPASGLTMWRECAELHFERLELANLSFDRRRLELCPPRGQAIVRQDAGGWRIAAGVPSLDLTGMLGETPIAIRSGAVGFAWPGALSAQRLEVALGPRDMATRFAIEDLNARIGDDIAGRFAGTDASIYAVPLDLREASGDWRFADGRLELSNGAFRLEDRNDPHRFEPMVARDAQLLLADNRITANALLREPASDAQLARVDVAHDLTTGSGNAVLAVDSLTFGSGLQPTQLTPLALGVVANVSGTVAGTGRIDWNAQGVTSSGRFTTESLDLAAAFGPVRGASGTITFTDLLGMTTAPDQLIRIASVNPGIEVFDGQVRYRLEGGELLQVESGVWPFLGGTLTMRPVAIRFGASEIRNYVFEIVGLEAARFIERMELSNLGATGVFDGTIPVVFDADGNGRLEGGLLISRPPGGNVAYVGELTYEDLSPMANYAFDILRSLNYRQMSLQMDGPLTGEIVTRVRFDGVSQGEGTTQNFITRRIARLPIRFQVNVRAPFYSLISSVRAMYDPSAIRDPREIGLLDEQGNPETDAPTDPGPPGEPDIQPSESEKLP